MLPGPNAAVRCETVRFTRIRQPCEQAL